MPRRKNAGNREQLLEACLVAYVRAGTLDLSLDVLARTVRTSKRMLVHYFGSREALEQMAMEQLENKIRARYRPGAFPPGTSLRQVVIALWDEVTSPQSSGVLRVTMDLTRRSWSGSEQGRRFFEEQQRLWAEMLWPVLPDQGAVEALLQLFQGAALIYLVTGDRECGRRSLDRFVILESSSRHGVKQVK